MKTSKVLNILIFSLFLLSSNTYAQRFSRGNSSKVGTISEVSLQEDTPNIAKQKNSWLVNGLKMSESDQESLLKLLEQTDEKNYRFTSNSRNKQQTYGSLDLGSIRMTKKGSSNGLERSAGKTTVFSDCIWKCDNAALMPNEATLNSKIEAIMEKYEGGGKLKKVEFEDAYWRN